MPSASPTAVPESVSRTRETSEAQHNVAVDEDQRGFLVLEVPNHEGGKPGRVYQCVHCEKRYERSDHVKRHIRSHENTRPFRCKSCARRFNRRDLLRRHQVVHEMPADVQPGKNKRADRVIQACRACTSAKTKCDDRRPCRRCQSRQVQCIDGEPTRRATLLSSAGLFEPGSGLIEKQASGLDDCTLDESLMDLDDGDSVDPTAPAPLALDVPETQPPHMQPQTSVESATFTGGLENSTFQHEDLTTDGIWQDMGWNSMSFHADLAHIYQDLDFCFDDELPSIYSESWQMNDIDLSTTTGVEQISQSAPKPSVPNKTIHQTSHRGSSSHQAFKNSPWLWTPSKQDHAYSSHSQLAVNEANIMASPEMVEIVQPSAQILPHIVDAGARDEMLPMVVKFSKAALKIRSFPSLNLLNVLLQAFFVKESGSIDSWVHAPTFQPDKARTEMLAGIVSAGSMFFAIPNIWKMGLALQEVVRLAICDALDSDNRLARDLETNQTFLMWIEIGLWSGFRRKMEVAEGFAHTVPTMLRRAGAFRSSHYVDSPVPDETDGGEQLRQKWLRWSESESYRRLVFRVLLNESRSSIAFVRGPVFSATELTLTLPAARDLWEARSPEDWKTVWLSKGRPTTALTLADCLRDPSVLEDEVKVVDAPLCALAVLCSFWHRVWTLADAKAFEGHAIFAPKRATTRLWLEAQHQELCGSLRSTRDVLERLKIFSAEARIMYELLMMFLNSSPDDIQSFAGRFGEKDSRSVLPQLREWARRLEYNAAMWHAGQVLKVARQLPPTTLRGFLAIAVYHASLLLWVATWLSRRSNAPSRTSPVPETRNRVHFLAFDPSSRREDQASAVQIALDGEESALTRAFVNTGNGKPALQLDSKLSELNDPATIPAVMLNIFRHNFPSRTHPLPPLLENLALLMEELSKTEH